MVQHLELDEKFEFLGTVVEASRDGNGKHQTKNLKLLVHQQRLVGAEIGALESPSWKHNKQWSPDHNQESTAIHPEL